MRRNRFTSRTSAIGAPSALKLPSGERHDSSFTLTLATPSRAARSGSARSGVRAWPTSGQCASHAPLSSADAMFITRRSAFG